MSQLVSCPECNKHLQVPDDLMGKKVQCPECKHTFTAKSPDDVEPSKTGTTISKVPPSKKPEWDKNDADDDDDDRGSRSGKKKRKGDGYGVEDRDDDDDDDLPRRSRSRRSSRRSDYAAHRGGMILAFGLIGLLTGFVVLAIVAWVMGNADLEEMRKGRMDPEGEGMTQAGRICGMIAVILWIIGILISCGVLGCFILIPLMVVGGAAAGAANNPNMNQPKRR